MSTGAEHFDNWWIGLFPGLAIVTVVLAFNLLGDSCAMRLTRVPPKRSGTHVADLLQVEHSERRAEHQSRLVQGRRQRLADGRNGRDRRHRR